MDSLYKAGTENSDRNQINTLLIKYITYIRNARWQKYAEI